MRSRAPFCLFSGEGYVPKMDLRSCLALTAPAVTAYSQSTTLILRAALDEAVTRNPELVALRQQFEAVRGLPTQRGKRAARTLVAKRDAELTRQQIAIRANPCEEQIDIYLAKLAK